MTRTCLAFATLALLAACNDKPLPRPEPAPIAAAPAAAARAEADEDANLPANMRLALQKMSGGGGADKAVGDAQGIVRQQMTKDDGWVMLGRAWVRKARESNDPGFYLNADACAGVVLERNPDHSLALDLRGLVLLNGHRFAEARDLAAKIIAKHPDDPMAWGTSSDALLEMGRYDEATAAAQRMVDLKPNLPSYSRASHLQWLRGDTASAKETVRAALDSGRDAKRDPEPGAWVLVQAAMIFWHEGDVDGAEAGFDKALERLSGYGPATVGKGRVAMARGEFKKAAELFDHAFKASPLVETAWLLGDAREAAGDKAGAEEAWARVVRDGRRTDPRTLSLFLSAKNRSPEEALGFAREEYAVRKDVITEDALAWALYRNGKIDEAKASITRARRLGTPDPRLVYHEGAIRIAAGETKKGKELVARALKMNPAFDTTSAKEAQSLLTDTLATR
jgi:tetratricopeptide (TPR) repeat protein